MARRRRELTPNASRRRPLRKKKGLLIAGAAGLAFVAGVLANLNTVIDFANRYVFTPDPRAELKAYPGGVKALPLPKDEPLPANLMANDLGPVRGNTERSLANLTARTGAALEEIVEYLPSGAGELLARLSQSTETVRLSPQASSQRSPVAVEAVQSPRNQQLYDLWFDVFLRNDSNEDLLFVSIAYRSRLERARGGSDSGAMLPNALYELPYSLGGEEIVALGPPYRLAAGRRGAIRFHFRPTNQTRPNMNRNHWFDVWIIDSRGRSRQIIAF